MGRYNLNDQSKIRKSSESLRKRSKSVVFEDHGPEQYWNWFKSVSGLTDEIVAEIQNCKSEKKHRDFLKQMYFNFE